MITLSLFPEYTIFEQGDRGLEQRLTVLEEPNLSHPSRQKKNKMDLKEHH